VPATRPGRSPQTYQRAAEISPQEAQQRRTQVLAWLLGLDAWPDEPAARPQSRSGSGPRLEQPLDTNPDSAVDPDGHTKDTADGSPQ
jgi:hypothetical protein